MVSEVFSQAADWHQIEIASHPGGHVVKYLVYTEDDEGDICVEARTSVFTDIDTALALVRRQMLENEKPNEPLNEKEIKKAKRR